MTTFAQHEAASLFIDKTQQCTQYTELNRTEFVTFSLTISQTLQWLNRYFKNIFDVFFPQNYKFLEHFQSDHKI